MAYSPSVAAELRRAVLVRAAELDEIVAHLRGPVGRSRPSLWKALALISDFPEAMRNALEMEWTKNPDPDAICPILTGFLRHENYIADFVDEHLAHGTRRELSESVVDEIRRELDGLTLGQYEVIIAHGEAYNFTTKFGDLANTLFQPLSPSGAIIPAAASFSLFKVPRIEGGGIQWRPILLGHEVAHVAVHELQALVQFDLSPKFDFVVAGGLRNPAARQGSSPLATAKALYGIAEAWATELICDAHALYRYGPSAVAALGEYFVSIGAMETASSSHPPGLLRMRLMLNWLGAVTDARLAAVVQPWVDLVPVAITLPEPWQQFLASLFTSNETHIWSTVSSFPSQEYSYKDRLPVVDGVADRLIAGAPGPEILLLPDGSFVSATDADVVNAVWVARVEQSSMPIDSLGKKTIESLDFLRRWTSKGGALPLDLLQPLDPPSGPLPGEESAATLSNQAIINRIRVRDERCLMINPLMHQPAGAAYDLRLGNRFIAFRRSRTAAFDPLSDEDDPRAIQVYIELGWREQFVLHPQEMVLGATLEYLVLPGDLAAQVITRSSYGRLGLLSATAVQIHPSFHGCLTLELVNLSTIPIRLTPGERIAQLVISKTTPASPASEKYNCQIGPEFSRVRADREAEVLRALRQG